MTTNWQPPTGAAPPTSPDRGPTRKRFITVATLLVVIAGLAAAAGLVMANRGDDSADSASYIVVDTPAVTPVFEPLDARGNDPFFPLEVQLTTFRQEVESDTAAQVAAAQAVAEPGEVVEAPEFDVEALDAAVKTGLYGGTGENTCDPERLISFLYANPDLGEAWAKVQGIDFDEIADYIRGLEVRVLAEDVNVLNHGYDAATGAAYEIDAVLAAGTAVLVDKNGDVRTRCYCGNPIKPKPPTGHMPPRCVVFGAFVFVVPGGTDKREGAPNDVLLTGKETTLDSGARWLEVKWGNGDNEIGWVRSDNLRKSYCPPATDYWCPGPGVVPVHRFSDKTDQIGHLNGDVYLHDQTVQISAAISPVGGTGNEVIDEGHLLIRFTEAAPSVQNSAWVALSDLTQDENECERIRQCVDTEGPLLDRAGGAALPGSDGVRWVEFTGKFAPEPATYAEVRVLDGSGAYGWISQLYTPLPPEQCEMVYDCVEGEATVYSTSTEADPMHLGHVANATVQVIGTAQDGRVPVRLPDGGPDGWIDEAFFFDGYNSCAPVITCAITTGPAWTLYPTGGDMRAAVGAPTTIADHRIVVDNPLPARQYIELNGENVWIAQVDLVPLPDERCRPTTECPALPYLNRLGDQVPTLRRAVTLDEATEMRFGPMDAGDDPVSWSECCVSALFTEPDVGFPAATTVPAPVVVLGTVDVEPGPVTWYVTIDGLYFRPDHIVFGGDCDVAHCPAPQLPRDLVDLRRRLAEDGDRIVRLLPVEDGSERTEEAEVLERADGGLVEIVPLDELPGRPERPVTPIGDGSGDCCVTALYTGPGFGFPSFLLTGPLFVDVTGGPVGSDPAWFMTGDGVWFPESAVVDAAACVPVECPGGVPLPGPVDLDLGDGEAAELTTDGRRALALSLFVPGAATLCCATGDLYDMPGGEVVEMLDAPTGAIVVDVSPDGQWHAAFIDGMLYWVPVSQFVDLDDCLPEAECPLDGSHVGTNEQGLMVCCASVEPVGAAAFFAEATLTGETRPSEIEASGTDYNTIEHGWLHESSFVGAGRCDTDQGQCPTLSVIDVQQPLTCCVSLGNGQFGTVMLTGETRTNGVGVTEYRTTTGDWLLETDFVGAGRCAPPDPCPNGDITSGICCQQGQIVVNGQCVTPCPTGQQRDANGRCFTPQTPCPTGQVRDNNGRCVTPPCTNSDQDSHCDDVDNCPDVTNENQADIDDDDLGDACDRCVDRDRDLFCDPQDNCPDIFNPDQSDSDRDGAGDACDTSCRDSDQDTICDVDDNCPQVSNRDQADTFGVVGVGDKCEQRCPDGDRDNDGVCNQVDNCIAVANPNQRDSDKDGSGDLCDRCPQTFNQGGGYIYDTDGDQVPDSCLPPNFAFGPSTFNPFNPNG